MTTRRNRRVSAPPVPQEERRYTEEDYAIPEPDGLSRAEVSYAEQMDWIPSPVWDDPTPSPAEPQEVLPYTRRPGSGMEDEERGYQAFSPEGYDLRYQSDIDYSYDSDLDDDLLTEEEQAELRRSHWQMLSNLADMAGVILGTIAILLLVTLLVSLLNWLVGDMSQSFILLQKHL